MCSESHVTIRDNYAITYASYRKFKIDRVPVTRGARVCIMHLRLLHFLAESSHDSYYSHGKAFTAVEYNVKNNSHMCSLCCSKYLRHKIIDGWGTFRCGLPKTVVSLFFFSLFFLITRYLQNVCVTIVASICSTDCFRLFFHIFFTAYIRAKDESRTCSELPRFKNIALKLLYY